MQACVHLFEVHGPADNVQALALHRRVTSALSVSLSLAGGLPAFSVLILQWCVLCGGEVRYVQIAPHSLAQAPLVVLPVQSPTSVVDAHAQHRTQEQHACPAAAGAQGGVVVCPLCAKAIHVKPLQSADAAFELHSSSTECDPSNYQRVHQKQRWSVFLPRF
eukprot:266725-Pelagomonas_calceolata.AAC.1